MTPTARTMSYEAAKDVQRCCIECYRSDCDCKTSDQFPVIPDTQAATVPFTIEGLDTPGVSNKYDIVHETKVINKANGKKVRTERQYMVVDWQDSDVIDDFNSQTAVNERGGKQAKLDTAYDCISPQALRILAQCLKFGKDRYGKDNCYLIDLEDHLAHAMNHINQYQCGDRSELHLVNAMARVMFALHLSIKQGDTPEHYQHPDMVNNG